MLVVRKTVFAMALMTSAAAYAGTPGWSVSEANGPVFVSKAGLSTTSTVARGATLSEGDIVSTGKGGRAVIVRGGEYLTVAPNTRLQLTEPKAGALTQIVQSFGNVIFKIQKKSTPHFQVNTPYLAAVVKGTTFSVTVTPAGTSVQVTEGLVQVQSLDGLAARFVSPGEIGMISSAAPGQLSVLGAPGAPAGGATVVTPAAPTPGPSAGDGNGAGVETPAAPASAVSPLAEVRIASPIGEGNVNLAAQTGGIVSGNSSLSQSALIEAVAEQLPTAVGSTTTHAEVASAAPTAPVAPIVEAPAPAPVVAEVTPPSAPVSAPPVEVAQVTPPVVESPALPMQAALPADTALAAAAPAPVVAATPVSLPPASVVEPPVLAMNTTPPAAIIELPSATPESPALPPQADNSTIIASGNAATNNGASNSGSSSGSNSGSNGSGSNSSGSNSGSNGAGSNSSGSSSSGSNQQVASSGSSSPTNQNPSSLTEFLQKLQDAAQKGQTRTRGN